MQKKFFFSISWYLVSLSLMCVDALITCISCSNCTNGEITTCRGEFCFSQASIGAHPGAEDVIRRGCYFQRQRCNTSTDWHSTLCCESAGCNRDLTPSRRSLTTAPPEGKLHLYSRFILTTSFTCMQKYMCLESPVSSLAWNDEGSLSFTWWEKPPTLLALASPHGDSLSSGR